jgi:HlyD family secretion protein
MADDTPVGSKAAPVSAGRRAVDPTDNVFFLAGAAQWLTLAIFGAIALTVVAWGLLGRLDYQAQGLGVILRNEGDIFTLQATVTGTVRTTSVGAGSHVRQGEIIAHIQVDTLLAQAEANKRDIESAKQQLLKSRTDTAAEIAQETQSTDRQVKSTTDKVTNYQLQLKTLQDILRLQRDEMAQGYATIVQVQQTQSQVFQTLQTITDAQAQLATLKAQLQDYIDQRQSEILKQEQQLTDAQSQLKETEANIAQNSVVRAPVDGTITEISIFKGAQITSGTTIASFSRTGEGLEVLAYFPVTQGKSIQAGMPSLVSPTYIEQEIYGSLVADVSSISDYVVDNSEIKARLGDSQLGQMVTSQGAVLQAKMHIQPDANGQSGLKWTSGNGAPIPVKAGAICSVSVVTQRIRPVELVVPLVKRWTGLGVPAS